MDIALSTPAIPRAATKAPARPKSHVPMVMKLAYRNLFHDRLSFFVTIIGIVFSVVLVAVQTGIYLGSEKRCGAPHRARRDSRGWRGDRRIRPGSRHSVATKRRRNR